MAIGTTHIVGGDRTATSAELEASRVVANRPVKLYTLIVSNTAGVDQFIQLFDAAALPDDGAVPVCSIQVLAGMGAGFDFFLGRPFVNGLVVCNSTTQGAKTIGAADCLFDVCYRVD